MKRRAMKGIPKADIRYGDKDDAPRAPLHRRLGIRTMTHRQAILCESRHHQFDPVTRSYSHQHIFRDNITLASI